MRGLFVATIPLLVGTCRLADLIGTPKAGFLSTSPRQPDSLTAAAPKGSTAPRRRPIAIVNEGEGQLEWTAHIQGGSSWLQLEDSSGTAPETLWVRMNPTGLDTGVYRDTVVVSATGASGVALQTPIKFTVHLCDEIPIVVNDSLVDTLTSADCGAPHRPGRYARVYRFNGTKDDSISVYASAAFDGFVILDTSLAPAALPLAQQDDCLAAPRDPCIFYQRLPATRQYWVEATSTAPGDTGEFTLQVPLPRDPNPPAALEQRSDSVTIVPPGGTIGQTTIILSAVVTDRDVGDSLHLEAEVRPNGTAFSGTPTGPGGAAVRNGGRATVTANVVDNISYHWRVRAVDNTGRPGSWVALGGNPDFTVNVPQPPNTPSGLAQSKTDGTTIPVAGVADTDVVVLSGTVTDPDPGDQLRIQVEVQPIGIAFTNVPNDSSPAVATGVALDTIQLGNNTSYHWQARTSDQTGRTSAWVSFGNNTESQTDFRIQLANVPNAPTALAQFQSDGTTPIPVGGATSTNTVVLQGGVSDPDQNQTVQLDVEVQPLATAFTNVPNYSSQQVINGTTARVTVGPLQNNTCYHWQASAKDVTGRRGAWVSFPISPPNLESASDFCVQSPPTQLVFTVPPPLNTQAGVAMIPAIQVTAKDINGNTSTGFTGNVVMTLEPNAGGATFSGSSTTTVAANAGVATFSNLSITKAGTGYVMRATTSTPALTQTSTAFNITPAPTTQLLFTTNPPASTTAGVAMAPPVVVTAEDAFLNPTPGYVGTVTLSLLANPGGGTLTGNTAALTSGVATFSNLRVNKTGTGYTLFASQGTLKPDTSTAFTITAAPPTHLTFVVQPGTTAAGSPITGPPQVAAKDSLENTVTSYATGITVAIGTNPPGNGILSGTPTVTPSLGVATFTNLKIDKIGNGYTLVATSAPLTQTTSLGFNVINSPISPTLSTVVATPTITACAVGCTTGGGTASLITVTARDSANNPVQGATVVLSATGTAYSLTQPATTTNALGQATGTLTSTSTADVKVVSAVISGVGITQTASITVNSASPSALVFTNPPTNTTAGVAINSGTGGVVVTARDQFGNTATSFASLLTMALGANPAGGVLSGTTTATASLGVATFPNLRIIKAGTGYQLQTSGGALTSPLSSAFSITTAPPHHLAFTTQPTTTAVLAKIDSAIGGVVVTVQDSVNNTTPFGGTVRVIIGNPGTNPGGGTLSGGGAIAAPSGIATFPNLAINALGTGYTLQTTSSTPALIPDESNAFDIIPGPAKTLNFTVQPVQTIAGQSIPTVQITARDVQGNTATGFTGNVTMAIGTNPSGGTLSGTNPVAAVAGIANFSNLSINNAGTGYTLTASTPALPSGPVTGATSNAFNIITGGASATQSTVTAASPITACGSGCTTGAGTASLITVTAKDGLGNPIAGATVTLSATGTANTITQPAGTTNVNGQITGTLSSTLAESKVVSAAITVGVNPPVTPTQTPTIVVNPASASTLVITKQPPASVTAGAAISPAVQVEVRDAFNNRVTGASNLVTLSVLQTSRGTLSNNTATPSGGIATFSTLSIDKATTTGVSQILTPDSLIASATGLVFDTSTGFAVNPAAVSAGASSVTTAQATDSACLAPGCTTGGATASLITVTARDQFNNVIQNATVAMSAPGSSNNTFTAPANTNASGVSTSTFSSTKAEAKNIRATVSGTLVTQIAAVTVIPAGVNTTHSSLTSGQSSIAACLTSCNTGGGTAALITMTARDAFDNLIPGAKVVMSSTGSSNSFTAPPNTNSSGVSTSTFTSTLAESKTVSATLQVGSGAIVGISQTASITVGAAAADSLVFTIEPTTTNANGNINPGTGIEVTAHDAFGNVATGFTGSVLLSITAGTGTSGAALNGANNPVTAVAGVATFKNLSIDTIGTGYTLDAGATGVKTGRSIAFDIN